MQQKDQKGGSEKVRVCVAKQSGYKAVPFQELGKKKSFDANAEQ